MATFLCSNTRGRDHARLYGVPFYDLYPAGTRSAVADDLQPGNECVVATPTLDGMKVEFVWFSFLREEKMPVPDEPGTDARVLFGKWKKSETLFKVEAVKTEPYRKFFDRNGKFKIGVAIIRG